MLSYDLSMKRHFRRHILTFAALFILLHLFQQYRLSSSQDDRQFLCPPGADCGSPVKNSRSLQVTPRKPKVPIERGRETHSQPFLCGDNVERNTDPLHVASRYCGADDRLNSTELSGWIVRFHDGIKRDRDGEHLPQRNRLIQRGVSEVEV